MRRAITSLVLLVAAAACGGGSDSGSIDGGDIDAAASADAGEPADASDAGGRCGGGVGDSAIVFATSTRHTGDLGGAEGADGICAARADEADLCGEFKAWISTAEQPAADRLAQSPVPYVRTDGVSVAANWDQLVSGELEVPIDRDERGDEITGDVWTGTLPDGTAHADTCDGFASQASTGLCGSSAASDARWTQNIVPACTRQLRLYCIEQ